MRRSYALAVLAVPAILAGDPARADICQAIDKETAEAGARLIREAGVLYYEDWFTPTPVEHVEVVPWEDLYEVILNGTISVDLAHAYLPGDGATLPSLGWQVGCGDPIVPKEVPARPFAPTDAAASPPGAPGIVGIVEAPRLHEAYLAMGELETPAVLRAGPSASSPVVKEALALDDLPTTEIDYELVGLPVYGREAGWYETRFNGAPAWLPPEEAGAFHDLAALLTNSLAYLDHGWDGLVFEAPDRAAPRLALDPSWRATMGEVVEVDVEEARDVAGELWLRLDAIWPSPCTGEDPAAVASGWVPAYGASGEPNVWFYSRGC
jgi:hypothetical protein